MKNGKHCGIIGVLVICAFSLLFIGCPPDGDGGSGGDDDPTPTVADFDIGNLSQIKDDGVVPITITPKSGKSSGAITIYYNGSVTLPADIGAYVVTFNVAVASGWKAATGLSAGTLTINYKLIEGISDLSGYLSSKPDNTKDTPYYIALNIDDEDDFATLLTTLMSDDNKNKYVYLDLSGSTITEIPNEAFVIWNNGLAGYDVLTGIIIPNTVTSIGSAAFAICTNLVSITIPNGYAI